MAGTATLTEAPGAAPAPVTPEPTAAAGRVRPLVRFLTQVVAWLVILGAFLVLAVTVAVPRLAGATPFTVLTGSMEPNLPPGTLVVTRPTDPNDIRIGQVVTFQIESGKPQVVTHRVVAVRNGENGQPEFLTQGDANDVVDEGWRPAESVRGVLWYAVPHLGRVNTVLTGDQRQLAVYIVAGALGLYALGMIGGDQRDRTRRRTRSDGVNGAHRAAR